MKDLILLGCGFGLGFAVGIVAIMVYAVWAWPADEPH